MKNLSLKFACILGTISMLTSCVMPTYIPKALNDDAKGITTVSSTPYGCKVLGEVSGTDSYEYLASKEALKEGAFNDLRNNAAEVVGKNKRITLRIIDEKSHCGGRKCREASRHEITAQVFECGSKD